MSTDNFPPETNYSKRQILLLKRDIYVIQMYCLICIQKEFTFSWVYLNVIFLYKLCNIISGSTIFSLLQINYTGKYNVTNNVFTVVDIALTVIDILQT